MNQASLERIKRLESELCDLHGHNRLLLHRLHEVLWQNHSLLDKHSFLDKLGTSTSENFKIPRQIQEWLQEKQELLAPGAKLPDWPRVFISSEDPPLFTSHPLLKNWYEEDFKREMPHPLEIERELDDERLLGVYSWTSRQIVIWHKGVDCCSKLLNIDYHSLFYKVLIHELGHWFNAEAHTPHRIPWDLTMKDWTRNPQSTDENPGNPDWRFPDANLPDVIHGNALSLSSRCYHEAWAQLFAWLYGHEKDAEVLDAFNKLEPRQSPPYQAWRKLVSRDAIPGDGPYRPEMFYRTDQTSILKSLEWSRSLKMPVSFDNPGKDETNLLRHLIAKSPRQELKQTINPDLVKFNRVVIEAVCGQGSALPDNPLIINEKLACLAKNQLEHFFNDWRCHPDTGPLEKWTVEGVRVDRAPSSGSLLFALIFKDEGGNGDLWLVLFTFDNKNNPIYIKIETKYFYLDDLPMQKLEDISASGGYKHNQLVNTVTKMTEKQILDNVVELPGREGCLRDMHF